jgi:hypothetical protein
MYMYSLMCIDMSKFPYGTLRIQKPLGSEQA